MFYINHGRFRFIALFGATAGFWVYYKTLGRLVLFCSEKIVRFIKYLVVKIVGFTIVPMLKVIALLYKITLGKIYEQLYSAVLIKAQLRKANKGFRILQTKGKTKDEKSFKYIREGGSRGIYNILHGHHNSDAV